MFIGHDAVAFAAKRIAPRTSLGTLVAAACMLDLIWPVLVLAHIERFEIRPGITVLSPFDFVHYPWSHSLAMAIVWGVVFGSAYFAMTRYLRGAVAVGGLVVSHWVLDVVTHRPDLPLWPGGPRVGLGLWNSYAGTLVAEFGCFAAGVWIYMRATRARDRVGRFAILSLVVFLAVMYIASLSPPPPETSITAIAWGAQAVWLLVLWAWWGDRHRDTIRSQA
jgi:hypothetical protein